MNTKLRTALTTVIKALEDDVIKYKWQEQGQCNCGLVVQAITGKTSKQVDQLFTQARKEASLQASDDSGHGKTWRDVVQESCSVTGEPLTQVFKQLRELGMTPKDIVHLEYLNNKAILKESGIKTVDKYYSYSSNLLKYLQAWVRIMNNDINRESFTKKELEEVDLIIASAFQTPVV